VPVRSLLAAYETAAADFGISLMPWQRIAARYITAVKGRVPTWRYREVCVVVARQNGKTMLLAPRILMGLAAGESILHTAQNREIPRKSFLALAGILARHPELGYSIRKGNGQEEVWTPGGGRYKLVAPNSGSRGESADLVLIDEVREQRDQELMDAMLPTITARPRAQVIYLSNAGDQDSVILNDIRARGTETAEKQLAYLEWSSSPERSVDDRRGWVQANPGLGHVVSWETLEYLYRNRPQASFETEHLCRWVDTMLPRVVSEIAWERTRQPTGDPVRPVMGVAQDPSGRRASAVIAWKTDEAVNVHLLADVDGYPVDLEGLADEVQQHARRLGIRKIAYDPVTDRDWARFFKDPDAITAGDYKAACERFARVVEAGQLRCEDPDGILAGDMAHTVRRGPPDGWLAARASDERATTASFAAIRAVWLATSPAARPPQVY
jgi:hypothetical protein